MASAVRSASVASVRVAASALQAVLRASKVTTSLQPGIASAGAASSKADASPVTVADFASEVVVISTLQAALGASAVRMVSEEAADGLSHPDKAATLSAIVEASNMGLEGLLELGPEGVIEALRAAHRSSSTGVGAWVLDPIDGTKGFLRGPRHQYAIGLGLLDEAGDPSLGVLACPNLPQAPVVGDPADTAGPRGVVLVGMRGQGCWQFPIPADLARSAAAAAALVDGTSETLEGLLPGGRRVQAQSRARPSAWRACESYEAGHSNRTRSSDILERAAVGGEPLRVDSMIKYALLARGDAHLYLRFPQAGYEEKVWDHAAGAAVLQAAGGTVTDEQGGALPFGKSALLSGVTGIVASACRPDAHATIIDIVKQCTE